METRKVGADMMELKVQQGVNELSNEAGVQVTGNREPGMANGLSPRELLEAAIALCTSITLESVLKRDGIMYNADEVKVQVVASKEEGVMNRFTHFDVELTLPSGLEDAYKTKLLKIVERGCTISNTVAKGAEVSLHSK